MEKIENMKRRLEKIGKRDDKRRVRMKLIENKWWMIELMNMNEKKLRGWKVKYGREEKVKKMIEKYRNFV